MDNELMFDAEFLDIQDELFLAHIEPTRYGYTGRYYGANADDDDDEGDKEEEEMEAIVAESLLSYRSDHRLREHISAQDRREIHAQAAQHEETDDDDGIDQYVHNSDALFASTGDDGAHGIDESSTIVKGGEELLTSVAAASEEPTSSSDEVVMQEQTLQFNNMTDPALIVFGDEAAAGDVDVGYMSEHSNSSLASDSNDDGDSSEETAESEDDEEDDDDVNANFDGAGTDDLNADDLLRSDTLLVDAACDNDIGTVLLLLRDVSSHCFLPAMINTAWPRRGRSTLIHAPGMGSQPCMQPWKTRTQTSCLSFSRAMHTWMLSSRTVSGPRSSRPQRWVKQTVSNCCLSSAQIRISRKAMDAFP